MNGYRLLVVGTLVGSLNFYPVAWAESLEQIVKQALNNHPNALIGLKKIQGEQEKVDAAWAGYLPTLDIAISGGGQKRQLTPDLRDIEGSTHDKSFTRKEGSLSFKQNIFSGFNTLQTVTQAKYLTNAEKYQLGVILEDLALQVTNAYLNILEKKELLELAEDNVKLHDKIHNLIKKRTEQGIARSSDLAQIEGRQAKANANLLNAHNNLADADSEYYALVGEKPPKEMLLPAIADLSLPDSLDEALVKMINHHPSILAADYKIKAAESDYKAQKSRYYPSLDLTVDQNWKTNNDGSKGTTEDFQAMVKLNYNLFRGGEDIARVQESAYKMEESRAEKTKQLRVMEENLKLAWYNYEFLKERIRYLRKHEEASQKTLDAYQEQFYIGKRTLLDLLDTENELFQSSQSLTEATYEEVSSRYRILSGIGQLLNAFNLAWGREWSQDD
ncbi:MAG: TolC family outer membrane protein [Endozoicomonas sp. (ex Botrylloides leachii)]|nr:TolC family outer membrane protein [Endozoicomonas sp. (ex Botrylloides leachii)]